MYELWIKINNKFLNLEIFLLTIPRCSGFHQIIGDEPTILNIEDNNIPSVNNNVIGYSKKLS